MQYLKRDLIKSLKNREIDAMAHGCNCAGGFGSGVAGAVAKAWPSVKKAYHNLQEVDGCQLGFIQPIKVEEGFVINMGTQQNYLPRGLRHVDYVALEKCLIKLKLLSDHYGWDIGIPMIGAGLGGGDWGLIESIIERSFPSIKVYYI